MNIPSILTEDELRAYCASWQELLGLRDWNVTVRLVRASEYQGSVTKGGDVRWSHEKRAALIRITAAEDYSNQADKDLEMPQDMEATLVHELLHLHTVGFTEKAADHEIVAEEQMVNAVARALVSLSRSPV